MKIVHLIHSLEMGGAEMLVVQLCRMQRAQMHDVSVCVYSQVGVLGEMLRREGFTIYLAGVGHPLRTMAKFLRHFRALKPDVVHCHNTAATIQGSLPARLAGVRRIISTRHGLAKTEADERNRFQYSLAILFCDWVVGICDIACDNLRTLAIAPKKRIVRIYNGAPPVPRTSYEHLQKSGFTLVFVGRLAPEKALDTLIRAVGLAKSAVPNLKLWIVGDGRSRSEWETLVDELQLNETVTFWGEKMETAEFFSAADVFVMSSSTEGVPLSLLQSMSLATPSIVTDVDGLAEIIRISQGGLTVPVGDSKKMAEAIVQLAEDAALRQELSKHALEAYLRTFTLDKMVEGYAELYS